jgi:hypothetical protein
MKNLNFAFADCQWNVFFLFIILVSFSCNKKEHFESEKTEKTITFILSADSPGKQYFQLAEEHFRVHPLEATDIVTSECRSIECVINYLNDQSSGIHWAQINLVAHGNSKTGLNLYLSDSGHKATPKRMVQEVALSNLPRLQSTFVDSSTAINILACGIGTNPMVSLSMKSIFRIDNGSFPNVDCSDKYVIFRSDVNGIVQKVEADYWPYYFKRGYRPSISEIEHEMQAQYPKDSILWEQILERPTDDALTMEFHIPISYTQIYKNKNDRPSFSSQKCKDDWAKSKLTIQKKLKEIDMDFDDFHWQIDKRIIKSGKGESQYAVKAIGMSTSMCFLKVDS